VIFITLQDISDIADDIVASKPDVYVLVRVQFHLFCYDKLSLTKDVNLYRTNFGTAPKDEALIAQSHPACDNLSLLVHRSLLPPKPTSIVLSHS
jgi:hypothetical protein